MKINVDSFEKITIAPGASGIGVFLLPCTLEIVDGEPVLTLGHADRYEAFSNPLGKLCLRVKSEPEMILGSLA